MLRIFRAVQADKGERSFSSVLPHMASLVNREQKVRGVRSLIADDFPATFQQLNSSRRGIEDTTEMSVMGES